MNKNKLTGTIVIPGFFLFKRVWNSLWRNDEIENSRIFQRDGNLQKVAGNNKTPSRADSQFKSMFSDVEGSKDENKLFISFTVI